MWHVGCVTDNQHSATRSASGASASPLRIKSRFGSVVQVGIDEFDNRVLVASDAAFDAKTLRAAVAAEPLYADALSVLSFRTLA